MRGRHGNLAQGGICFAAEASGLNDHAWVATSRHMGGSTSGDSGGLREYQGRSRCAAREDFRESLLFVY
jgi:hypothetical protein